MPATGELVPMHMACSHAGLGAGGGCPLPLRFLMPNPAFGGDLGQKIN